MKAQDLASYIINRSIDAGQPVSNLKLQKMMYFINLLYIQRTGQFLIEDIVQNPFEAWQFGPVIENVYDRFSNYGGLSINLYQPDPIIDNQVRQLLDNDIFSLLEVEPWTLVSWSHAKDGAWDITYKDGWGNHQPIDNTHIMQEAGR